MGTRKQRKAIATKTVQILDQGFYHRRSEKVMLTKSIQDCVDNTEFYTPEALDSIITNLNDTPETIWGTQFVLRNETTLKGIAAIAAGASFRKIAVLNFASANNPGGGFLNGSEAQEESLARSSALTVSLQSKFEEFYLFHRHQNPTCLYSDRIIYSPACPVFRNDASELFSPPYHVNFITSPAPNAHAIYKNEPEKVELISSTLKQRAEKIIALALHHKCDYLILGAWGCGVFKNIPFLVATTFLDILTQPKYKNKFSYVLFSVLDKSKDQKTFKAFQKAIAQYPIFIQMDGLYTAEAPSLKLNSKTIFYVDKKTNEYYSDQDQINHLKFLTLPATDAVSEQLQKIKTLIEKHPLEVLEQDTITLLAYGEWRNCLMAGIAIACGVITEQTLYALWGRIKNSSHYIASRLVAIAFFVDPLFKEKALQAIQNSRISPFALLALSELLNQELQLALTTLNIDLIYLDELHKKYEKGAPISAPSYLKRLRETFGTNFYAQN